MSSGLDLTGRSAMPINTVNSRVSEPLPLQSLSAFIDLVAGPRKITHKLLSISVLA